MINCDLKKNRNKRFCIKRNFPIVFKHPRIEKIVIVYKKGIEEYKLNLKKSKSQIDKEEGFDSSYKYGEIYGKGWNPHHEVDILKDNGFKRINDSESIIWRD